MAIRDYIVEYLREKGQPAGLIDLNELYEAFPLFKRSSIRSAVYSMERKEELDKLEPGLYSYEIALYQGYSHSKRIAGTNSKKPQNRFKNVDIELTIEGVANTALSHEQIDDLVNPILVTESLLELSMNGILLIEEMTDFIIAGSEWKPQYYDKYNPYWEVEIKMVNNSGKHYVFHRRVRINETDFY